MTEVRVDSGNVTSPHGRYIAVSRRFSTTWKSVVCGEEERPISFGDKSIMFIRLILANADDHSKQKVPVTSTSAKQQRALKLRV